MMMTDDLWKNIPQFEVKYLFGASSNSDIQMALPVERRNFKIK